MILLTEVQKLMIAIEFHARLLTGVSLKGGKTVNQPNNG